MMDMFFGGGGNRGSGKKGPDAQVHRAMCSRMGSIQHPRTAENAPGVLPHQLLTYDGMLLRSLARSLQVQVEIELADMYTGKEVSFNIQRRVVCRGCRKKSAHAGHPLPLPLAPHTPAPAVTDRASPRAGIW